MSDLTLLWCCLGATLLTVVIKIVPITFLNTDNLPPFLRRWLDFVPVAVMGALVGSDVFFYNGRFDLSSSNLYLLVSIPTIICGIWSKNYLLTIALGLGCIIVARALGYS